jgi:hypothetical protein
VPDQTYRNTPVGNAAESRRLFLENCTLNKRQMRNVGDNISDIRGASSGRMKAHKNRQKCLAKRNLNDPVP